MTNTVRPAIRRSMPSCTMRSVRVSMELVASSRISTGGSATAARAMASSCRWPCERFAPVACQQSVVAVRKMFDERVGARQLRRSRHLCVGGVQFAVADVVRYGACEQVCVLQNDSQAPAQIRLLILLTLMPS